MEHSEDTVRKMKKAGVNLVITHFYKGFGFEIEKEEMEETRRFAEIYPLMENVPSEILKMKKRFIRH